MKRAIFSSLLGLVLSIAIVAVVAIAQPSSIANYASTGLAMMTERLYLDAHRLPASISQPKPLPKAIATNLTLNQVRGDLAKTWITGENSSHGVAIARSTSEPCTCPQCLAAIGA